MPVAKKTLLKEISLSSDQEKLINKLVHSSKLAMIGQLTAGIAHELRNPLAIIRLETDEITFELEEFPENIRPILTKNVEVIQRNIKKMVEIIEQVQRVSRKPDEFYQKINMHELISSIEKIAKRLTANHKINLMIEQQATEPFFYGNATKIEQVLLNLITNATDAISHSGKGSTITVRTLSDSQKVKVEVQDDGPGVKKDHLPALFDPFFTTKEVGKGLGLGLSITAEAILAHGGEIDVDSNLGEGTRFHFWVPHDRREMARMKRANSQKL